jgi:DEAD/DEAH box helicase
MTSPSEQYAKFRRSQATPVFNDFAAMYDFELDDFQIRACHELEAGNGVLVAAPTGSGKTLVGEFAVHLALEQGRKCFYTTPIKALSNQKFADLQKRYGADKVGLLTGDPPPELADQRQPHEGHPGQRLVGDRVGDLAEVGDQVAAACDVAVDLVGDHRGHEEQERDGTPQHRLAVVDEQRPREERDHQDPQRGERVGEVPVGGRNRDGLGGRVGVARGHRALPST